jgi:predicted nuclease of predicted toxin-antitoxin system
VAKLFSILLDQNVPLAIVAWLQQSRPQWDVKHTSQVGLDNTDDDIIYEWAQQKQAIIITFDEDFADKRFFSTQDHPGVVRLRVWPTTIEEIKDSLQRLLSEFKEEDLFGALVIIDRQRIRVRSGKIKIIPDHR